MNRDIKTVKMHCVSRTLSQLTHNAGTSGNETIINQEPVSHDGVIKMVPVLSGNAIRHRMIREPGAMHIIKTVGLYGKSSVDILNYMFNGGALTKSGTTDNMKVIAKMQELIPLVRLLGGCLPNQIIGGSLITKRGILMCNENFNNIEAQLPEDISFAMDTPLRGCQDFIGKFNYYTNDPHNHKEFHGMVDHETYNDREKSSMMPYSGQTVVPGAAFYHGFILQNVSILEYGALIFSIEQWLNSGGTIGGSQRVGHGQIELSMMTEDALKVWPHDEAVGMYVEHVESNKKDIAEFLGEVFADKRLLEKIKNIYAEGNDV